jgi:hypothetical protein
LAAQFASGRTFGTIRPDRHFALRIARQRHYRVSGLAETYWGFKYKIKNFGRTPAHNVVLTSIVQAVDWNDGNPQIPVPKEEEQLGSMAPNGDFYDMDDTLTSSEL